MNKINVGILGYANIAKKSIIPEILRNPNFNLAGIASRSEENKKEIEESLCAKFYNSYQKLCESKEIDLVYIPLPPALHKNWIIQALLNRKHVVVEKPISVNYAETEEIINIANRSKCLIVEAFQFLHHRQVLLAKRLLEMGVIGSLVKYNSSFGFPPLNSDNFRYKKDLGGGAILDAGVYPIRGSLFFGGSDLCVLGAKLNFKDQVDISGAALLKDNAEVIYNVSWGFNQAYQCNIQLVGSEGIIDLSRAFTAPPTFPANLTIINPSKNINKTFLIKDNHFSKLWNKIFKLISLNKFAAEFENIFQQSRLVDKIKCKAAE